MTDTTTALKKIDLNDGDSADPADINNGEHQLATQYLDSICHNTARLVEATGISIEAAASIAGNAVVAAKLEQIWFHMPSQRRSTE